MSFAITSLAPRLNADVFANQSFGTIDPPELGKHVTIAGHDATAVFMPPHSARLDDWCGTVPKHFPFPVPPKGGDDGWCGTVPKHFPLPLPPKGGLLDDFCGTVPRRLPFPVPPTPPGPWLDLANAAQSFR